MATRFPNHCGSATLGLVLAVLLCTTQDLLVSSSPLRSVCSTAGTPPRVSVKSCPDIPSDTNSGFYSIRYLANTHCCPSHTTPAFLLVGWMSHRTCQNPHMPTRSKLVVVYALLRCTMHDVKLDRLLRTHVLIQYTSIRYTVYYIHKAKLLSN